MSMQDCVLAIDQGTTSTRSIVFDRNAQELAAARQEFPQHYPNAGWVEHCPEDIWRDVLNTARAALDKSGALERVAGIGITNQRETIVVWERATGKPIHRAIVWQDRRTATTCQKLREEGAEDLVRERTGLLLDPYFSATKLAWILDNVSGARARAEKGELAFGTIDSFILWRLTGGKVHATDATNAARTSLFDIHRQIWDEELLRLFRIPAALLPEVRDSSTLYGETDPALFGRAIPIAGIAGDQQAAVVGQACFTPGMAKATYGTGCFVLLNTGDKPVISRNRMLTTIAYRLNGKATYALEGSIFVAGAAIKWLRDGLHLITHASQTDDMATRVPHSHGVYMVPGFVGLGAPHWDPDARGLICGLTLDATAAHIARAALESVAFQTLDLVTSMQQDGGGAAESIRVDGGMSANDWYCQFLADMLQAKVERPRNVETTAMGAGFLAGMATGIWESEETVATEWARGSLFEPKMEQQQRRTMIAGWHEAVKRTLSTYPAG
ncbi:glycerol kinase GlpK [Acetobacter suratthaniensis]|uniref:Glycerol kinase n=1 Tax=Acetobacter suratthaniensis TaxID=1502841 RepID=A0ABS3LKR2_9PROT|nr:glycerol kinase GlpK [Acetobacter suratthaniensis]MBO1327702.1 glycerol kinase GlpK [Acetobacter suratthaniensis]MCX2565684.1 glycerol kinase GlpK [Acetobacter suratthaniensis]